MSTESIFTDIYNENTWRNRESRSGCGSMVSVTAVLRPLLAELMVRLDVKSLLDLPCGDWNWMRLVNLDGIRYIGADIVRNIVAENQKRYPEHKFIHLDLLQSDLPKVDLILCRDCLVHFAFADVKQAVANMRRSGSTYLLTTTFAERAVNRPISTGRWSPYNLQIAPFNFPAPLVLIDEQHVLEFPHNTGKYLGLWRLN